MKPSLTASLGALAVCGALTLSPAAAQSPPAWRFQTQTADFVSYIDTSKTLRHQDLVWYQAAKVYRTPQGPTIKRHTWVTLHEGRCSTWDYKTTRIDGVNDDGVYAESQTWKPTEWRPTQPGQVGRTILENVCGKPLPPGPALSSITALIADGKARLGIR